MDLLKLLANLDSKRLDSYLMVQDSMFGEETEHLRLSFIYERLLYLIGRVYSKVRVSHPNHELVRKLEQEDIIGILAIGAPSYDGWE